MSQITSNQLFGECLIPYAMKAKNAPNSINTGGTVCAFHTTLLRKLEGGKYSLVLMVFA